jgi:hypothetical protein
VAAAGRSALNSAGKRKCENGECLTRPSRGPTTTGEQAEIPLEATGAYSVVIWLILRGLIPGFVVAGRPREERRAHGQSRAGEVDNLLTGVGSPEFSFTGVRSAAERL